jgi:hypothetical protein
VQVSRNKFDALADLGSASSKAPRAQEKTAAKAAARKGKRGNPDYVQLNGYVLKDTRRKVNAALAELEEDYSDLLEHLLREWLKSPKPPRA